MRLLLHSIVSPAVKSFAWEVSMGIISQPIYIGKLTDARDKTCESLDKQLVSHNGEIQHKDEIDYAGC
jgi:hypothetical protein